MNKSQKNYYQLFPVKVFEILPQLETSMKEIPGFSSDNLKELISVIAIHVRNDNEAWTPLKTIYLRNLIPQGDQYLKYLRDFNIIERSGFACAGLSSYEYRFCLAYRSRYIRMPLSNPKLLRRIRRLQESMKKRNSKKYPGQNEFLRQMTIKTASLEYVKQITEIDRYNYYLSSITRIMNGDITFQVDKTSGRFHSNLTNMPKALRQFVRINGIPLTNLDVKNCQPYLSIILLINPRKAAQFTKCPSFSLLLETLQVNKTEDVEMYVSLVLKGQLYEYLWDEFTVRDLYFADRDEVKRQVLIILFARNVINPPTKRVFKELFPEVDRVFSLIRGYDKGSKFISFKRYAILLQRIESHIILNLILIRINREHPGTIAVTIHDSVMTSIYTDQSEKVKKIMIEEFTEFVGYQPRIKEERGEERERKKKEEEEVEGNTVLEPSYVTDFMQYNSGHSLKPLNYPTDYQHYVQ